jgi:16S rRNA (guanine966-N2)-methyltransferase
VYYQSFTFYDVTMKKQEFSSVRLISGKWRSRRVTFPVINQLRPTSDRVRETVFNWLGNLIPAATCLDLFSGSGALGFEALSRGAAHVTFIDSSSDVISAIHANAINLQTTDYTAHCLVILDSCFVPSCAPYDIVFLDPPFCQGLLLPTLGWLQQNHFITENTVIYFEVEKASTNLVIDSPRLSILRYKTTKSLTYGLCRLS